MKHAKFAAIACVAAGAAIASTLSANTGHSAREIIVNKPSGILHGAFHKECVKGGSDRFVVEIPHRDGGVSFSAPFAPEHGVVFSSGNLRIVFLGGAGHLLNGRLEGPSGAYQVTVEDKGADRSCDPEKEVQKTETKASMGGA